MIETDKQYEGRLIDDYKMLKRIRKQAVAENATEVIKMIDEEIEFIKLKLQPLELPD